MPPIMINVQRGVKLSNACSLSLTPTTAVDAAPTCVVNMAKLDPTTIRANDIPATAELAKAP